MPRRGAIPWSIVREIRERYEKEFPLVSYRSLAGEYGISKSMICKIVNLENYKEV